jgi:hypothetical protein
MSYYQRASRTLPIFLWLWPDPLRMLAGGFTVAVFAAFTADFPHVLPVLARY